MRSVSDWERPHIRVDFRRHQPLVATTITHQDDLAGPEFRNTVAAKRFHVHEDILGTLAAAEETETLGAVEPLDERAFQPAFRRHRDVRALLLLFGRMDRGRGVHRENAKCLQAAITLLDKADNPSAFERSLETITPQTGHMEQDIAGDTFVWKNKAVSLGNVEPFDRAGNLQQIRGFADLVMPSGIAKKRIPTGQRGFFPIRMPPFSETAATDSLHEINTSASGVCKT